MFETLSPRKKAELSYPELAACLETEKTEWLSAAACRSNDRSLPQLFYSSDPKDNNLAKAICFRCPVRLQCAELALITRERFGIWGGLDERERSRIWRRVNAARNRRTEWSKAAYYKLREEIGYKAVNEWNAPTVDLGVNSDTVTATVDAVARPAS